MKSKHQKWIDGLKVGDVVCDCRYQHRTITAIRGHYVDFDDGWGCDAYHCCGPVDHEPHWWVYLLRCKDGTYYIGITLDLERRLKEHGTKRGAKYTRGRAPFKVVKTLIAHSKSEALRLEAAWKRVPKSRKTKFEKSEETE